MLPDQRLGRQVARDVRDLTQVNLTFEGLEFLNPCSGIPPDPPRDQTKAEGKALQLLMSYLTPHQKMTMARHGFLYQRRGNSRRWYALYDGRWLLALDPSGHPLVFRGIGISARKYPRGDALLAQLLMLRANPGLVDEKACRLGIETYGGRTWRLLVGGYDVMPLLMERRYWPGND